MTQTQKTSGRIYAEKNNSKTIFPCQIETCAPLSKLRAKRKEKSEKKPSNLVWWGGWAAGPDPRRRTCRRRRAFLGQRQGPLCGNAPPPHVELQQLPLTAWWKWRFYREEGTRHAGFKRITTQLQGGGFCHSGQNNAKLCIFWTFLPHAILENRPFNVKSPCDHQKSSMSCP